MGGPWSESEWGAEPADGARTPDQVEEEAEPVVGGFGELVGRGLAAGEKEPGEGIDGQVLARRASARLPHEDIAEAQANLFPRPGQGEHRRGIASRAQPGVEERRRQGAVSECRLHVVQDGREAGVVRACDLGDALGETQERGLRRC